ncbi:hypothetical protein GJV85_02670 [Sulfurimonas aquatica]|uniref:Uncharacterized protein n=1 Tax=Sulfurimonas aquatica TaxID=2672570 RepID=A0A975GC22_9BACT|nr:hypothetical protein [Sulfurimonas aquatica]QSZ41062.1 hypothetical protein GJV85_02670 [Sulfurimonas aquatica]
MNQIKLSVNDENLETILMILNNLKEGLILEIETNGKPKAKATQYQPKANTIIREENSGTNDTSGKYLNASAYKKRVKSKN